MEELPGAAGLREARQQARQTAGDKADSQASSDRGQGSGMSTAGCRYRLLSVCV